jgi:hypothetical protein
MSLISTSILAGAVKAFITGRKEHVARAGASSVFVYMILCLSVLMDYNLIFDEQI